MNTLPPRHDYKTTWDTVSGTKYDAFMVVSGYTDEEKLHADAEDTLRVFRETVGIRPDDVFLEIGCGIGRVGRVLAPFVKEWIGCDVSKNMLHIARRRCLGLENVRFQEISGYDLKPIPDESIDVVYCTVVFMHLEEWDRYNYLCEAFRVLRPGGRVYCDNANLCGDAGWRVFEESRTYQPHARPPHISKCSTPQEIETFLTRAGFRDAQTATRLLWVCGWGVKPR